MKAQSIQPNLATFDSPQLQYFSLPSTLIYYISKNPFTVEGLLKLQKTCKYFFAKNKIIVNDKYVYIENNQFLECDDLKNEREILKKTKYWLNNDLTIRKDGSLNLLKAINRCTLKRLTIYEQNLTLEEFNFLIDDGKNINWLYLDSVNIRNKNGFIVTYDQIFAKVPNISWFYYNCKNEIFTSKTFEKMNSLIFKSKIKVFDFFIYYLSPETDISLLCEFIQKNTYTFSVLGFSYNTIFVFYLRTNNAQIQIDVLKTAINNIIRKMEHAKMPHVIVA